VDELNGLLAHSEKQAEEARTHAGNLAHALKTPLTVVNNAATAHAPTWQRRSSAKRAPCGGMSITT
jgi:signal transduction histidine kinase